MDSISQVASMYNWDVSGRLPASRRNKTQYVSQYVRKKLRIGFLREGSNKGRGDGDNDNEIRT